MGSLIALGACTSPSRQASESGRLASAVGAPGAPLPKVRISTWTSPKGVVHELAIWRPELDARPTGLPSLGAAEIERVYVVPGSGCTGMAPILPSYFEGLHAREVIVLHKPHVRASDWPRPARCRAGFVAQDELAAWSQAWRSFVFQDLHERPVPPAKVLLVGISEGAELLPGLMADWPDLGLVALLGSTGLDPWRALMLQLQREQDLAFAQAIQARLDEARHSELSTSTTPEAPPLIGGRTLAYWQSLRDWAVATPLAQSRTRTVVLMGAADAVQAPEGLLQFAAEYQRPHLCTRLLPGADHGLRIEGAPWAGLWPLLEGLMTAPTGQAFAQRCAQPG